MVKAGEEVARRDANSSYRENRSKMNCACLWCVVLLGRRVKLREWNCGRSLVESGMVVGRKVKGGGCGAGVLDALAGVWQTTQKPTNTRSSHCGKCVWLDTEGGEGKQCADTHR